MVPSVKYSINSIVSGGGEHAVMAPGSSTRSSGPDLAAPCGALGGGRAAELGRATYSWAKAGPSFPPPAHLPASGWADHPQGPGAKSFSLG